MLEKLKKSKDLGDIARKRQDKTSREPTPALIKTRIEAESVNTDGQDTLIRKMHIKQASGSSGNLTSGGDKKPIIKIKKCQQCAELMTAMQKLNLEHQSELSEAYK